MRFMPTRYLAYVILAAGCLCLIIAYSGLVWRLGNDADGGGSISALDSLVLTADIVTGESVMVYSSQLSHSTVLWLSSWFVKIIAWLIVPTVIATVIGRLIVDYEKAVNEMALDSSLRAIARLHNYPPELTEQFVADAKAIPCD